LWLRRIPLARSLRLEIDGRTFFGVNAAWLVAMSCAVALAPSPGCGWLLPALALVVAVNGRGYLVGSVATRSYSPGLISGLLLWLPLGGSLIRSRDMLSTAMFWVGIGGGIAALVLVLASAVLAGALTRHAAAVPGSGRSIA
jgi:hypothetical protein